MYLERQMRALKALEVYISDQVFFVGERITIADVWVAVLVQKAVRFTVDANAREGLPGLLRHVERMNGMKEVRDTFGEVLYMMEEDA